MKRIIISTLIAFISILSYADESKCDTIEVTRLETSYKGKLSFSAKNVVNITYNFKSDKDEYQVICYGQPTIIQRGVYPTLKYGVKKAFKNGKKIELKSFETIPNPYENKQKVILYY